MKKKIEVTIKEKDLLSFIISNEIRNLEFRVLLSQKAKNPTKYDKRNIKSLNRILEQLCK